MARNWILALAAICIWVGAFGWYFIGTARLRAMIARRLRWLRARGP